MMMMDRWTEEQEVWHWRESTVVKGKREREREEHSRKGHRGKRGINFLRVDWAQVEGVRFLRLSVFLPNGEEIFFFSLFFVLNCLLFWGFMPGVSVQFSFQFPLQSALWQCLGKKNRYTNKIELKWNWVTVLPSSWVSKKNKKKTAALEIATGGLGTWERESWGYVTAGQRGNNYLW